MIGFVRGTRDAGAAGRATKAGWVEKMSSVAGGQYVFSVIGQNVALELSSDGKFPTPTDNYDIAVFTTDPGPTPVLPDGYEAAVFAPGGTIADNLLVADSLTILAGSFHVADKGGSDSITAGGGDDTIAGGIFDTVIGGTGTLNVVAGDRNVVQAGAASAVTVNALVDNATSDRGELIQLGAGNAEVLATGDDTVLAGSGLGSVQFFAAGDAVLDAALNIRGATPGLTFTVTGANGDELVGGAQQINAMLGDSIAAFSSSAGADTINALSGGKQSITLDGASATVYAAPGDSVFAGAGKDYALYVHLPNDSVFSQAFLEGAAAGATLTIAGAAGAFTAGADSVNVIGTGGDTVVVGGASAATVNALAGGESVNLGGGQATVYAGLGADTVFSVDTVNVGGGKADITFGNAGSWMTATGAPTAPGAGAFILTDGKAALSGSASNVNLISLASETVNAGSVSNITINALNEKDASTQLINLGSGAATVYADAGDTINAGTGSAVIVMQDGSGASITGGAFPFSNITVSSAGGTEFFSAANATIRGIANDTIVASAGNQLVNGAFSPTTLPASTNEEIRISGGSDTVFAGSADTIGVGAGALGDSVVSNQLWLDSNLGSDSVGYGTFLPVTAGGASKVAVTVGQVADGKASETFDVGSDFVFVPTGVDTALITAAPTDVSGIASTLVTLPDGTTMTLIGVTDQAQVLATAKNV